MLARLRGIVKWYLILFALLGAILIAIMAVGAIFSSDLRGQLLLQSHTIHGTATGKTRDSTCGRHTAATDVQVQWQEDGTTRFGWLQLCGVNKRLHRGWPYDALPGRGDGIKAVATPWSDTLHFTDKDNIYVTMLKGALFAPLVLLGIVGAANGIGWLKGRRTSGWLPD